MLLSLATVACLVFLSGCAAQIQQEVAATDGNQVNSHAKRARLRLSYPSVTQVTDNTIFFVDGTSLPYDDKRLKNHDERLENADVEDHFTQTYPALTPISAPGLDRDPGRFRNDDFLKKLYGGSQIEVDSNLVVVDWMPINSGEKLLFNKNENAAGQLHKVSQELDKLPSQYMIYIVNIDSTYEYRPIQGTNRLSPHSYGIAIDLETKYTSYWLWDETYNYRNEIPQEIVDIFEKHGFVWGGRWYHYDTMHFEYRPEMFERVW